MSEYKSYLLSQLGIKESTFKPVDIDPESIDPQELQKGIGVEKEHTQDDEIAKKIALHHLAEDPKYYSRMDKAGLKEFSPMKSIMSPTAKFPQVLGISVRGSSTGGLPSGGMPSLGPTSLSPSETMGTSELSGVDSKNGAALGGLEVVSKQNPNSVVVDNTPQNQDINSAAPIAKDAAETPSENHPAQVQNLKQEPAQALTGTTPDKEAPMGDKPEPEQFEVDKEESGEEDMSLKGACPQGLDIDVPEDGTEEPEGEEEEGEESPTNVVKDEDDEDKDRLAEGKHKKGCQCGFCKNKGNIGKRNVKSGKDDPNEDEEDEKQFRKDRSASPEGDAVRKHLKFGTSLDEVFERHKKLMQEKLGVEEEKTNECKPCGCKKPNTKHIDEINHTKNAKGDSVIAVGAPGSDARKECEKCPDCKENPCKCNQNKKKPFNEAFERMRGLANLGERRLTKCGIWETSSPVKKAPKLTNESLRRVHEQLVRKSQKMQLNEQEKEVARRILTRLRTSGGK